MINAASDTAKHVDQVMLFILGVSVVLFVGIMATMVFFVIKFHRKKRKTVQNIGHHTGLEIAWTVIPLIIVLAMFWAGYIGYGVMRTGPADALQVTVTGRMWSWIFTYDNGIVSEDALRLPEGVPVRINVISTDVIHSVYIPAFRVKMDAVPGRETFFYVTPKRAGTFDLFCAEYCGDQHAYMISKVKVLPRDEFEQWYRENAPSDDMVVETAEVESVTPDELQPVEAEPEPETEPEAAPPAAEAPAPAAVPPADLVAQGEQLMTKYACFSCHSSDGSRMLGPTLKGLYGSNVTVIVDGQERTVVANEEYLERSIRDPNAEIVKGFQPLMPPQAGMSNDEMQALIAYIKSLR